jgi:hypothetical protein
MLYIVGLGRKMYIEFFFFWTTRIFRIPERFKNKGGPRLLRCPSWLYLSNFSDFCQNLSPLCMNISAEVCPAKVIPPSLNCYQRAKMFYQY